MAVYPTDPKTGVSSWQAWSRSQQYLPKGTSYDSFMTADGGPSYWQRFLRGDQFGARNPSVPRQTVAPSAPAPRDYLGEAQKVYEPLKESAIRSLRAKLADSGLLRSTAGAGAEAQVGQQYDATIADWAERRRQYDQSFGEGQRQFDMNFDEMVRRYGMDTALKIYELGTSGGLAREQLAGSSEGIWYPDQPKWWESLWKQNFAAPQAASGPQGDPPEWLSVPSHQETRRNLARDTENRIATDSDAQLALDKQRLALQQKMFEADQAPEDTDPWADITAFVIGNRQLTPDTGQLFPTDVMAAVASQYDLDIIAEARSGNERALAVLKLLYPESWRERLEYAAPEPTHAPVQLFPPASSGTAYPKVGSIPREMFPVAGPNPFVR